MCVAQPWISAGPSTSVMWVGTGQAPALVSAATILITPVVRTTPVNGFEVRFALTDRVRRPSGVSKQLQHSDNSSYASKMKISAQRLEYPAAPSLSSLRVASGAPPVLAFEK